MTAMPMRPTRKDAGALTAGLTVSLEVDRRTPEAEVDRSTARSVTLPRVEANMSSESLGFVRRRLRNMSAASPLVMAAEAVWELISRSSLSAAA